MGEGALRCDVLSHTLSFDLHQPAVEPVLMLLFHFIDVKTETEIKGGKVKLCKSPIYKEFLKINMKFD